MNTLIEQKIETLNALRAERIAQVEAFIDSLKARNEAHPVTHAAGGATGGSFRKIWHNTDDAG